MGGGLFTKLLLALQQRSKDGFAAVLVKPKLKISFMR